MKRLTIEQQERRLSNSEAKIFKKVLDSLGIQFTIDVVEETPIDLRIIYVAAITNTFAIIPTKLAKK